VKGARANNDCGRTTAYAEQGLVHQGRVDIFVDGSPWLAMVIRSQIRYAP
jgi:hypothetical protein